MAPRLPGSFVGLRWQDKAALELLWECGCTVTIQIRLCASPAEIAKSRNLASEKVRALGHPALSDTFWTFAKVVQLLKIEKVSDGEDLNLRYNNTIYNRAMHQAATAVMAVLRDPKGPVEQAVRRLDLEFGRNVLSNHYSKLSKLLAVSNRLASATRSSVDVTAWLIESLTLALRMKFVVAAKVTETFLDRNRKTGDAGFWLALNVVLQASWLDVLRLRCCCWSSFAVDRWTSEVFDYAAKLVAKLPQTDKVKLEKIMADLRCPVRCWELFLHEADADQAPIGEDDLDMEPDEAPRPVPQSKIGAVKEGFNRAIGMLLDLLLELVSGKYYKDCCTLASGDDGLAKALTVAQSAEEAEKDEAASCSLINQLKIIVDKFDNSTKSVGASSAAPAPSLLQSLARVSEGETPDDTAERERQWKLVQAERRKFVSFGIPAKVSKDGLLHALRNSGKVFTHKGTLNSSHRLICASADLMAEDGTEPWAQQTSPADGTWKEICAFANALSGPEDFVILFDGRMRNIRRLNESWSS